MTESSPNKTEKNDVDDIIGGLAGIDIAKDGSDEGLETLKKVADMIESGECNNIIVLSGAGISVAAGIPDFRTPGTGLYDNLQKYHLPFPEAVFDIRFYKQKPIPFCSLAQEIWPGIVHSPTLTHSFLSLLAKKNLMLRSYTQNIDGLEHLALVPDELIVECHGNFRSASCASCGATADIDKVMEKIVGQGQPPICEKCGGYVKPDIVFFGESLPDRFNRLLGQDLKKADLLIVMGTSLTVAPVSMIPEMLPKDCPRVLFNRELVGDFRTSGKPRAGRKQLDLFQTGDCDASVQKLCQLLGWEEELLSLNKKTRVKPKADSEKSVEDSS